MATVSTTVVSTEIGAAELAAGVAYIHEIELEGEPLHVGQRVEILDGAGHRHRATVDRRVAARWRLLLDS